MQIKGNKGTGEIFTEFLNNNAIRSNFYFWRSVTQREVDFIEQINGELNAYEIKWNVNKKPKLPLSFAKNYEVSDFKIISRDNFWNFVTNTMK